ncbi:unnamed protein product, partial [Coregonus sp. 'balchen']
MICNLTEESIDHQCYAALGGSLSFRLTANTSDEKITLKKGHKRILHFKTGEDWRSKFPQDYVNRSEFFNNGTFRLDRVTQDNSGDYLLEIYNSEGTLLCRVNVLLEIQETMVTCSSEGDGLQYSWTLNGQNLSRS